MKAFLSYSNFRPLELLILLVVAGTSLFLMTTTYSEYAILPSLVLLVLLILAHYPQLGFYLIVILMPMSAIRQISETDPTLTITKFLGLGMFFIFLLHFFAKKINLEKIKSNLWPWFLLFFIVYLLSALWSIYPETSTTTIRKLLVAYVFFLITIAYIDSFRLTQVLPKVIIAGVTISSLLGIAGTMFGLSFLIREEVTYARALGGNFGANSFSSFVVLAFPLVVHYFFTALTIRYKLFCLILLIIYSIAIMSSYSRGGLLAFSIVLLMLLFEYRHKFSIKTLGFALSFMILLLTAVFILTPTSYVNRIESVTDTTDTSMSRRLSYLDVGMDIFKEHPIFGTGPGTYRDEYASTNTALIYAEEDQSHERLRRYAHNTYLEVLSGTGLIGLLVFLIILVITLNNFIISKKQLLQLGAFKEASLISAYKIAYLSVLVYFFMLSNLYLKQLWLMIAVSHIAVVLARNIKKEKNERS